jgi:hypothetical protein
MGLGGAGGVPFRFGIEGDAAQASGIPISSPAYKLSQLPPPSFVGLCGFAALSSDHHFARDGSAPSFFAMP